MLYDAYEVQRSFLAGASKLAGLGAGWLTNPANPLAYATASPLIAASLEVFSHASAPRLSRDVIVSQANVGIHLVWGCPIARLNTSAAPNAAANAALCTVARRRAG